MDRFLYPLHPVLILPVVPQISVRLWVLLSSLSLDCSQGEVPLWCSTNPDRHSPPPPRHCFSSLIIAV
ncbi:hypothetical protein Y1Q_0011298 [Alligator mississippiensis]|uniref:Uncharacterized protein n=1 Tax=Alligator mississippiensis TaxID=8496 RepID=A0A151N870_ALLMI|nr:hypothetical protein Y1Q_0011298 [Alligator mississippiensis]